MHAALFPTKGLLEPKSGVNRGIMKSVKDCRSGKAIYNGTVTVHTVFNSAFNSQRMDSVH